MLFTIKNLVYVNEQESYTALNDIPAMQRRRLSSLAKIALHTARAALQGSQVDYIVWSSCYGDEKTTASIIQDIAHGEMPSPTQFSTSVHNAISGLYSILFKDETPATSLSSVLYQSWQDAILEAYSYLKQHQLQRALIVYYDAPLPDIYQVMDEQHKVHQVKEIFAIGAILSMTDEANLSMYLSNHHQSDFSVQPQAFYDFWLSEQKTLQHQNWIFDKC